MQTQSAENSKIIIDRWDPSLQKTGCFVFHFYGIENIKSHSSSKIPQMDFSLSFSITKLPVQTLHLPIKVTAR